MHCSLSCGTRLYVHFKCLKWVLSSLLVCCLSVSLNVSSNSQQGRHHITSSVKSGLAGVSCKRLTACSCEFENGDRLDFSDIIPSTSYYVADNKYDQYSYYWNPCYGLGSLSSLTRNSALAQGSGSTFNLIEIGQLDTADFISKPEGLAFTYRASDSDRHGEVNLICDPANTKGSLEFSGEATGLNYIFKFTSSKTCSIKPPTPESNAGGWTPGEILLLLVFLVIVAYVLIGVAVNVLLRHRSGITEVLPQFHIWTALPRLAWEGCKFTYNKIRCKDGGSGYSEM